jgi:VWFA-related protein
MRVECTRAAHRPRGVALVVGVVAMVAALVGVVSADDDLARVVLVRPAADSLVAGEIEIVFIPQDIDDASVREARVYLDGRLVGQLDGPPWRVRTDAGSVLRERRIDVEVELVGGRIVRAGRTYETEGLVTEVDVRLVSLGVSVLDRRGRAVEGLEREDFAVFDGGRRVEIERWSAQPEGLALALVMDTSGSMAGERLEASQSAAMALFETLGEDDRLQITRFSDEVDTRDVGDDFEAAEKIVASFEAEGGTALYDAVAQASRELSDARPAAQRAIILLSDGRDEASSGLEPGSFHTFEEAVRRAHEHDVQVFALGIGAQLDLETDFAGRRTTREVLERLADSTGGRFEAVRSLRRLRRVFRDVLAELRTQYSIAYTPPPAESGESWRRIDVRVDRDDVIVRTREGYYAR